MVAGLGLIVDTPQDITQRRRQAVLRERYVSSLSGGMSPHAAVTRSMSAPDVGTDGPGTAYTSAGADSLARQRTRNLTRYFAAKSTVYRRGVDDILGRGRNEEEDADWETILMVEQMKNSAVEVPKLQRPATLVQQNKAKQAAMMMQRRDFARSFKLAADAVLGADILARNVSKKRSKAWTQIRVSTQLAAAAGDRVRLNRTLTD